jgi:hypothetical protein
MSATDVAIRWPGRRNMLSDSMMPADGILAATKKNGLRHVRLAARGQIRCPFQQRTLLAMLLEGQTKAKRRVDPHVTHRCDELVPPRGS